MSTPGRHPHPNPNDHHRSRAPVGVGAEGTEGAIGGRYGSIDATLLEPPRERRSAKPLLVLRTAVAEFDEVLNPVRKRQRAAGALLRVDPHVGEFEAKAPLDISGVRGPGGSRSFARGHARGATRGRVVLATARSSSRASQPNDGAARAPASAARSIADGSRGHSSYSLLALDRRRRRRGIKPLGEAGHLSVWRARDGAAAPDDHRAPVAA